MTPRLYAVALAIFCSACGPEQVLVSYPSDKPVLVQADDCILGGADGWGEAILEEALDAWDGDAGTSGGAMLRYNSQLFPRHDVQPGEVIAGTISITCADLGGGKEGPGTFVGIYSGTGGNINIDKGFWSLVGYPECNKCVPPFSLMADLLEHELGHALGMSHVQDPGAVMFWSIHPNTGFTSQDHYDLWCAQYSIDCDAVAYDNANEHQREGHPAPTRKEGETR